MEEIHVVNNSEGAYSCDVKISVEEWQEILSNPTLTTGNYKRVLMAFYNEPEHKATCTQLSIKYYGNTDNFQKFNSWLTNFSKAVTKHLNRFKIIGTDGNIRYWHVTMCLGKEVDGGKFETTLRPELVQAIENLGWNKSFTWIPFYMEMAKKLLQFKNNRKHLLDIIYKLDAKHVGYIRTDNGGKQKDIDPFTVIGIFNRQISDSNRKFICNHFKKELKIKADIPSDFDSIPLLNNQQATFFWRENVTTDIQPIWNLFEVAMNFNEEEFTRLFNIVRKQKGIKWNITMGFYWILPYDYISLDTPNRNYLSSYGFNVFKEKDFDAEHYLHFLQDIKDSIQNNKLKEKSIPEISYSAWTTDSNTPVQPIIPSQQEKNYWLVGYSFGSTDSQFDRFVKESIWEGRFKEKEKQEELASSIKKGDVLIFKSTSTKGPKHDQPFLRIKAIAVAQEDIVSTKTDEYTSCICKLKYYSLEDRDFDGAIYGAYRKTIHEADEKAKAIIDYANDIIAMDQQKYTKYIKLLTSAKNLVLTGAPGTGKTFMAQAIAEEMGAETRFVQFHPSYDYTDFVEGLRPIDNGNGQIGFERKDGVFKEFCKEAIKNILDSEKSVDSLTNELSWKEDLEKFIEESIDSQIEFETVTGSKFCISEIRNSGNYLVVKNEQNEKANIITISIDEILEILTENVPLNIVKDIRSHFGRKFGIQSDSYVFAIVKKIRKLRKLSGIYKVKAEKINRKPFVFIIDEINRGEVSKIFGELFYAIDPGYRGHTKTKVQTQYQNLVPENDVFASGFYIPENVYILATMNDIDRSVESMDFAIRRRFTWKEVSPGDTIAMLDKLACATEAKDTMTRLNKVIENTEGLGEAYMIGPSYFLKLSENKGNFNELWSMNIKPLLKEYLRGFRKSKELLDKFEKAYFNSNDSSDE